MNRNNYRTDIENKIKGFQALGNSLEEQFDNYILMLQSLDGEEPFITESFFIAMQNLDDKLSELVNQVRHQNKQLDTEITNYSLESDRTEENNLIDVDAPTPTPTVAQVHIAFIVGHTNSAKGAYSPYLQISEWDYWHQLMNKDYVKSILGKGIHSYSVHYRPANSGYNDGLNYAYASADEAIGLTGLPGMTVELHFNSSTTTSAQYSTTLYHYKSGHGSTLAAHLEKIQTENRSVGARPLRSGDRGYSSLTKSRHPSILIEPFFGSNPSATSFNFIDYGPKFAKNMVALASKLETL